MFVAFSFNGSAWTTEWLKPVVWNFRVPRVFTAFIIGVMLAIRRRYYCKGVLRNPLADASILGVTFNGWRGSNDASRVVSRNSGSIYAAWRSRSGQQSLLVLF